MPWYAASAMIVFRLKSGAQHRFTLHENVILVQGQDEVEARRKAEQFARDSNAADDTLTVDGLPAVAHFCGLRKLTAVSNIYSDADVLGDGAEVTYSVFEVEDESAISALVDGDVVTVRYVE